MSELRRDLNELHPLVRKMIENVLADIKTEKLPFEVFEAYRTPSRQRKLFNQGGVTKADAWRSYHQYGMAVDLVMKEGGQWSWRTDDGRLALWERMNVIGRKHGLEPLSWEKPHLQLAGTSSSDLRAGRYPPGGDDSWAKALNAAIESWPHGAPPAPILTEDRPRIPELDVPGGVLTSEPRAGDLTIEGVERVNFERAQAILAIFEGGYVNHPADRGGPTNFGITHTTLARWRGVSSVSPLDVERMKYDEAKDIYFANYWSKLKCGAIPGPLALAIYNVGVHCGVGTAAEFLQIALNVDGAGLKVDGDIGPLTIGATNRANIATVLSHVIQSYEARLMAHPRIETFRAGFISRVSELRSKTDQWLVEWRAASPAQSTPARQGDDAKAPQTEGEFILMPEILKRLDLVGGLASLQAARTDEERIKAIRETARRLVSAAPELAPVNNALGSPVGSLLNGNKSLVGLLGSVAAALFSQAGPESVLSKIAAAVTSSAPVLAGMSGPLLPIFIGLRARPERVERLGRS